MLPLQANAVFEGGGVKAIGLAGAAAAMEEAGYRWACLAGTSAGALVAALLAAGYTGGELGQMLEDLDFRRFADRGRLPPALALVWHWGLYRGRYFEGWLRDLLAARGVHRFGDLRHPAGGHRFDHRLQVIASDLTHRRLLVLPGDVRRYGLNPDDLEVARAVRMSGSVPFFYRPVLLRPGRGVVVDGGLLSNFPVWIFDAEGKVAPTHPTFGFRLVEPGFGRPTPVNGPISLAAALINTMLEAHDRRHVEERERVRTVDIPTLGVSTLEFDLSRQRKRELFAAGRESARRFLGKWDFPAYVSRYCLPQPAVAPGPPAR